MIFAEKSIKDHKLLLIFEADFYSSLLRYKETLFYTHITTKEIRKIKSPPDNLNLLQIFEK